MRSAPMHILLLEIALTGHHAVYLRRIAAGYLTAGCAVTVSVRASDASHAVLADLIAEFGSMLSVLAIDETDVAAALGSGRGDIARELAVRGLFARVYASATAIKPVNYVLMPYLDYCLYAVALLGAPFCGTRWSGICMRPSFHFRRMGVVAPRAKLAFLKQLLFMRLLREQALSHIYSIDELLVKFVKHRSKRCAERLVYLADPAELTGSHTYESARLLLGMPADAVVVLLYGAVDARKGLAALIESCGGSDGLQNVHFLIVGKQSKWASDYIAAQGSLLRQRRIHSIDRFVNDDEQQQVFASSDVVWIGYLSHYTMSGVLVLAALSGKPVVSSEEGLIGWYVRRFGMGASIDVTSVDEVRRAILSIVAKDERGSSYSPRAMQHFICHDWKGFTDNIVLSSFESEE